VINMSYRHRQLWPFPDGLLRYMALSAWSIKSFSEAAGPAYQPMLTWISVPSPALLLNRFRYTDCLFDGPALAVAGHYQELIATPTGDDIGRTERCLQHAGDSLENQIPGLMALPVVDLFEVVDIQRNQHELLK